MLEAVRIYPSSSSLRAITVPSDSSRKIALRFLNSLSFGCKSPLPSIYTSRQIRRFGKRHLFLRQEGSLQELDDSPVSIELEPISSETMFDRVIKEAQNPNDAVVIVWRICERSGLAAIETKDFSRYLKKGKRHYGQHGPLSVWPHRIQCGQWMANWCRKCIYLKPQLEKLAAEYYPGLRFYHVDVNTVSHKLVARAGVTKMPTIQLWMNGEKRAEVIGGHKPYLVINEVRQMIEDECIELS